MIEKKLEETKRQIFANLSAWDRIKIARHPKRPFTLDYLESAFTDFSELHGDRLFAEDRAVVGGFACLGRPQGDGDRHAKGPGHQGEHPAQFRLGASGRLSQGAAADAVGRQVPAADHHADRHRGGLSGHRGGGTAHRRGHRGEPARDDGAGGADYRRGHWRRRLGRRAGHRRGGPGADPGKRLLLGDQPGRLRGDSLEGPLRRGQGRRGAEDHRQAPAGAGAGGRDHPRTAGRRAYEPRRWRLRPCGSICSNTSSSSRPCRRPTA